MKINFLCNFFLISTFKLHIFLFRFEKIKIFAYIQEECANKKCIFFYQYIVMKKN